MIAGVFGISAGTDVFFVALSLSQLMRNLALEGAVFQTLVAVFANLHRQHLIRRFVALGARLSSTALITTVVMAIVMLSLPIIPVTVFGGGFLLDPERLPLAFAWLPTIFLYSIPIALVGIAAAMQNAAGHFTAPAMTPLMFNLILIAALLITMAGHRELFVLIAAIPVAGLLQWLFHQWRLWRVRLLPLPTGNVPAVDFGSTVRLCGPALITVIILQLTVPVNNLIASFLPPGSLSVINYANRLAILPVGLIGVAAVTVIMPSLAKSYSAGDTALYKKLLGSGIRTVVMLGLPATAGLILLADAIAVTLFGYGEIAGQRAAEIALALRVLATGIVASMLVSVLTGALFARNQPRLPLTVALVLVPLGVVIKLLFVIVFHLNWQLGYLGLTLGIAAVAWLNAALLWKILPEKSSFTAASARTLARSLTALLLMCTVLLLLPMVLTPDWTGWSALQRALGLATACLVGAVIYLGSLWLLGERLQTNPRAARH